MSTLLTALSVRFVVGLIHCPFSCTAPADLHISLNRTCRVGAAVAHVSDTTSARLEHAQRLAFAVSQAITIAFTRWIEFCNLNRKNKLHWLALNKNKWWNCSCNYSKCGQVLANNLPCTDITSLTYCKQDSCRNQSCSRKSNSTTPLCIKNLILNWDFLFLRCQYIITAFAPRVGHIAGHALAWG
jgi:hypothetical protein